MYNFHSNTITCNNLTEMIFEKFNFTLNKFVLDKCKRTMFGCITLICLFCLFYLALFNFFRGLPLAQSFNPKQCKFVCVCVFKGQQTKSHYQAIEKMANTYLTPKNRPFFKSINHAQLNWIEMRQRQKKLNKLFTFLISHIYHLANLTGCKCVFFLLSKFSSSSSPFAIYQHVVMWYVTLTLFKEYRIHS